MGSAFGAQIGASNGEGALYFDIGKIKADAEGHLGEVAGETANFRFRAGGADG